MILQDPVKVTTFQGGIRRDDKSPEEQAPVSSGDTVVVYLDGPNTIEEDWKMGTVDCIEEKFGDTVIFGSLDTDGEFFIGRGRDGWGDDKIRKIEG